MVGAAKADTQNIVCVGDSVELNAALYAAVDVAKADGIGTEIRIKIGNYSVHNPPLPFATFGIPPYRDLSLRGGYDSNPADNCTTSKRVVNPTNTTVELNPYFPNGYMADSIDFRSNGDLVIEGLTLQGSSELSFIADHSSGKTVSANRNIFKMHSIDFQSSLSVHTRLELINNKSAGVRPPMLLRDGGSDTVAFIANNTFVNAPYYPGIALAGLTKADFYNNIIWGNALGGIYDMSDSWWEGDTEGVPPVQINLVNNILQPDNNIVTKMVDQDTLYSDPQFVGVEDFHLQPTSPGLNTGFPQGAFELPATDLDGNPRIVGPFIDRGAYESPVSSGAPVQKATSKPLPKRYQATRVVE